jgi:outer membrane protein assembly factor BamB/regulation of enolase protein 1 (concanavalin A-like superfamily)
MIRRFLLTFALIIMTLPAGPSAVAATDDWSTSLHDVARTAASSDTTFSTANANQMALKWSLQTGGPIAATPTVSGGVAYFGSWDGYEYAVDAITGALKWKTFLGITTADPICIPPQLGISSPATVQGGVVYVGGGDSYWYALDAVTGAVNWRVFTGDNSAASGHYNWSGPLVYNGYAYIGIASEGDCPLVQGQLLKVNLTSHQIENTLNIVPNGQLGGGIWTSPALDTATNTIFTATGTENNPTQPYAQAFLAIDASTMAIKDHWRLPESEAVLDSDFSTSTTLFNDAGGRKLVTSINKNGVAYTFDRGNLAAGPVWKQAIAVGGFCPTCGVSSVSSGAFGGGRIYLSGAGGVINGQGFPGTVRALNPATGAYLWQHGTSGSVIGALAYANGLVFVGAGSVLEVLDAATGNVIYSYETGAQIYSGPSVANGMVYTANVTGRVYAFNLGSLPIPAADPNCPSGFTCQDVGGPAPAGSESVASGTWNISAGGGGLTGTADSFRLMTKPASGSVQISAQVTAQQTVGASSQAGVILRQDNTPGSPFYAVMLKPNNQLVVQYRTQFGVAASTVVTTTRPSLPVYVMIQRNVNKLTAATSTDGTNWTLVPGSDTTMVMPAASSAGLAMSSGTNGTAGTATIKSVAVGGLSVTPAPAPPATACPSGWACQDVGNPAIIGDQSLSAGTWTIKGAGGDIWEYDDQFHLVSQALAANGTVSARVTSQTNTDGFAKAGVMMRQGTASDAPYYAAYVTPGGKIEVQYRDTRGLQAQAAGEINGAVPAYLRVARYGSTFTAYTSTDGATWTAVPSSSTDLPNLSGSLATGMAITSHNTGVLGTATLTNVAVSTTAPPPPNLCPSGWTCQDIGFPTPKGDQSLNGNTWTVEAGGGDIWDTYDQFRMISQNLNGDGGVSARLASQSNTGEWAKAGTMLRLSSDPQAPYYAAFATPGHGVVVQWRTAQAGTTSQVSTTGTVPLYLKVTRTGTTFSAYTSPNGTTWTLVPGSTVGIAGMSGTLLAGMAADSWNPSDLSTTTWDNVAVTTSGGGGGLPSPWVDGDVGGATPAGSATYANNTFTVKGGGTDIWGATDQMNYVNQPITGDGSMVARVTSQTNTDSWAKSGIIWKQTTTAGAPYAAVFVTPGNGVHFQYGFNSDVGGGAYTFPNGWLKLTRAGNVFTAYSSSDGANWVKVGQATIAMTAAATTGMFVNAHNGGTTLNTTTYDNVAVTGGGGGALPSPWTSNDIGTPLLPGSASYSAGTFTVKGSGNDIWGATDQLQFVAQPLTGDGQIVARVTSQDNTDPWAKSGIMIKNALTAGSPYSAIMVTPGNGLHMQSNFNTDVSGGTFAFPNAWLKLVRSGTTITTYKSTDGLAWTQVGTATVALGTTAQVGLFVCAHNGSVALNTTVFDNVSVTTSGGGGALPTGWLDADVGAPALAGSASYAGGVFTVKGSGNDIWGTTDQFNYAYKSLVGDGQIVARVASQDNTDTWAKSGVMIKQSTAAGTNYAALMLTPGNGVRLQSNFNSDQSGGTGTAQVWLKLVRTGTSVTAYRSTDGAAWTQVGAPVTLALTSPVTIGLFVCAHNGSVALNTTTFDSVTVTP